MYTLSDASEKILQAFPRAADWAQQATHVLVLADFSLARALFIVLARPLAGALLHLATPRPSPSRS